MVGVIVIFALLQIVSAQRSLRLADSTREFTTYVEKARQDSIRRHAQAPAQMATVTVNSANSYTVTMDFNGDGALDASRTINTSQQGVTFSGTLPVTIRFNWRGRTVDASGNLVALARINLNNSYDSPNAVDVSGSGDTSINGNMNISPVNVNAVTTNANIRPNTQIP
jgi:hypothetical protein